MMTMHKILGLDVERNVLKVLHLAEDELESLKERWKQLSPENYEWCNWECPVDFHWWVFDYLEGKLEPVGGG